MIRFLLGWFGYTKVPKEAIELSMKQEDFFKKFMAVQETETGRNLLEMYLKGQQTLTSFLRSGRLLQ